MVVYERSLVPQPCTSARCVWMGDELKPQRVLADLSVLNPARLPVVINVLVWFPSSCVFPEENTGFAFPKGCSVPTVKLSWGSWVPRLCHDIVFPSRCTAPTDLAHVPHEVSSRSQSTPHLSRRSGGSTCVSATTWCVNCLPFGSQCFLSKKQEFLPSPRELEDSWLKPGGLLSLDLKKRWVLLAPKIAHFFFSIHFRSGKKKQVLLLWLFQKTCCLFNWGPEV